jgi:hypothetical protein
MEPITGSKGMKNARSAESSAITAWFGVHDLAQGIHDDFVHGRVLAASTRAVNRPQQRAVRVRAQFTEIFAQAGD